MTIYSIGSGGLKPCKKLSLHENIECYMGDSDSPKHIVITRVTEDRVYFTQRYSDYREERFESRPIIDDLIKNGTTTWLEGYGPKHFPELAESLKRLLDGGEPDKVDPKDFEFVTAAMAPAEGDEHAVWRAAKSYGVMHGYNEDEGYFSVRCSRQVVEDIREDEQFTDVRIIKDA